MKARRAGVPGATGRVPRARVAAWMRRLAWTPRLISMAVALAPACNVEVPPESEFARPDGGMVETHAGQDAVHADAAPGADISADQTAPADVAPVDSGGVDAAPADGAGGDGAGGDLDIVGADAGGDGGDSSGGSTLCTRLVCVDGNPCTDDACVPDKGCVFTPNTAACDDGNPCTQSQSCKGGVCAATAMLDCDDGNVCTKNACELALGCVTQTNAGPCDDQDPCTPQGQCEGGACKLGALDCVDDNPCTDDACVPGKGCAHLPNTAKCEDGDICTEGDACSGGVCTPGGKGNCDDGNDCTSDVCDVQKGCTHAPNSNVCIDGDVCTLGDKCKDGKCTPLKVVDCDDGQPCTKEGCDPKTGCTHANLVSVCDDGDKCTTSDECQAGKCVGKAVDVAKLCGVGAQPCVVATCDPKSGCAKSDKTGPCDDGDVCTEGDACSGGACKGTAVGCDDGDVCTDDACASPGGCVHEPNTASCDDGDACTEGDTCKAGKCAGTATKVDADKDKFFDVACGGKDCDDADPTVYPGAPELCDGKPNDCDAPAAFEPCHDLDGDGFCAAGDKVIGAPPTCPAGGGDCSDGNPYAYPGAAVECFDMVSPQGRLGEGPCDLAAVSATLHMAWLGSVFNDLRYRRVTSGVVVQSLPVDRAVGLGPPAIAADAKHGVFVAYTNAVKKQVHVSILVGGAFKRVVLAAASPGLVGAAIDSGGGLHVVHAGPDAALHEAVLVGHKLKSAVKIGPVFLERGRALVAAPGDLLHGVGRSAAGDVVVFRKKAGAWSTETLQAATALGAGMSIAVSSGAVRHVCFQDAKTRRLRLAWDAGGKWSIVDVPGQGQFGAGCQVSVDADGSVQLAYVDAGGVKVLHSRWVKKTTWQTAPIDGLAPGGLCGMSPIGAIDVVLGQAGGTTARYAYKKWTVTPLESPSACPGPADLAIDAQGAHHLVAWSHPKACYAADVGGKWSAEVVSGPGVLAPISAPAVAVDKLGAPLLAWTAVNGTKAVLQVARGLQGGWKPEVPLSWPGGGDGFGYPGPHLVVAPDGGEHVAVLPHVSSKLWYAARVGAVWKGEVTSASGIPQSWAGRVSFAVGDAPHLLYCTPAGQLRHASRGAKGVWSTEVVEQLGCAWVSLSGAQGKEVTALYSTGTAIRFVKHDGAGWTVGGQTPPDLPLQGGGVSSAVDKAGVIRAVHRTDEAVLYTAGKPGSTFVTSPLLPPTCHRPRLRLSPGGKLAVACSLDLFAWQK